MRVECFDISHLGGTEVVGSMVVFEDGLPRKSEYRRFKLSMDRNDDFAAMREVIRRRFARYVEERARPVAETDASERKFAYPPSLVIVDGGVGQLNAALDGVADLPVDEVSFVGLAKRFEELWRPGQSSPVVLPRGSEALFLVQRIRDEAHRFAVTYHRSLRGRRMTESALDAIPGVGPARRRALLDHFGSLKRVREASEDALAEVDGISERLAAAIHAHFRAGLEQSEPS